MKNTINKNAKTTLKYIKNTIKLRKNIKSSLKKRDFNNLKIVTKCNKILAKNDNKKSNGLPNTFYASAMDFNEIAITCVNYTLSPYKSQYKI